MAINSERGDAILELNKREEKEAVDDFSVLRQPLLSIISGDMLNAASTVSKAPKGRRRPFQPADRPAARSAARPAARPATRPASQSAAPQSAYQPTPHSAPQSAPQPEPRLFFKPAAVTADIPQAIKIAINEPAAAFRTGLRTTGLRIFRTFRITLTEGTKRLAIIVLLGIAAAGIGIFAASSISNAYAPLSLPSEDSAQQALMAMLEPEPSPDAASPADLPPLPSILVERKYTVARGDTIQTIARRFGIWEDTLISANSLTSRNQIRPGKVLTVPNMNGIYHTVRKNENLSVIARAYRIDITKIVDANNLESTALRAGERIFIPNARLSASAKSNFYGDTFVWPARGPISSPFGYRSNPFSGARTFHSAIDIVMNRGTPIKAVRDGVTADAGYNAVFGNYVIIRHSGGFQSLYAHLDAILVKKGASVSQGQVIGRSGNTGQSTGPHLHFSLFLNGKAVDPRKYMP